MSNDSQVYLGGFSLSPEIDPKRFPNKPDGQAARYNTGKPKLSMVLEMPDAVEGVAKVLEFGATKYARSNFLKGLSYTEVVDSMLRHLSKFSSGENIDPESKLHHAFHIACNAMFLAQFVVTHTEFDDRSATNVHAIKGKPFGEVRDAVA